MPHGDTVSSPLQRPARPWPWQRKQGWPGSLRGQGPGGWTLGVHRVPGIACQSVCGVGDGGWQTGKGVSALRGKD